MYSCMQRYDTREEVVLFIVVVAFVFLKDGQTALINAVFYGNQATVEILLAAGANVDIQGKVSKL